jgi:UDP-glucose:(heptosyl)LPS alpha-1,3-glucosyltransferase
VTEESLIKPLGKRLKIAVFNRHFRPTAGGAERYSIALVENLATQHDIHVFAQQIDHAHPRVTYHRIPEPFEKPRWLNQLWFALATWWYTRHGSGAGFDVIHSHENTWHGQVQTVHVLPIRYTLFQGRTGWKKALRWLKIATSPRLLSYWLLEAARYRPQAGRQVVAASGTLADIMRQTYPATAAYLSVITPAITQVEPIPTAAEQQAARIQLGLPPAGFGLLMVANDFRRKGLPAVQEALSQLKQKGVPVWLAVVGNSEPYSTEQGIYFLGKMSNPSVAYTAADCLVHPTLEDTFAMVVLEAMAHHRPVIVSSAKFCGISALLTHEKNALLLDDPRDATAIADSVERLMQSPDCIQHLMHEGRQFAANHIWSVSAAQQNTLYRTIL